MLGEYEMTQDCASAGELESAINALHGELDKIAKDGRQAFAETKKAQMEASARAKGS